MRRYSTGRLDAIVQLRGSWRRGQLRRLAERMPASSIASEPHWACPSCGAPCSCDGAARFLAHRDCERWDL